MTDKEAKQLAICFMIDCQTQADADGYQQCEEADWHQHEPKVSDLTGSGFVVTIGGKRVHFVATVEPTKATT